MPVRELLVGDIFRDAARAVPARVAASLGAAALTFGEVQAGADRIRPSLARAAGHGDRLAVWSATDLRLVPLFAAAAQAGVVFVPLSPLSTADEARAVLRAARPALLVADEERLPTARALGSDLEVPVGSIADLADATADRTADRTASPPAEPAVRETDPHVIFFTSGSSGRPKGVVLSHRVGVLRSHPGALFEPRGVAVCSFPLFHMAAWTIALQQWHARDAVVFVADASADEICAAVRRNAATRLNGVPAVWRRLLDHPDAARDLASIRFADTGTSATPPDLLEGIAACVPDAQVRVFYGSTEAGNVASLAHADHARKPGSVGLPSVSTELRLAADGEVWVRSPLLADGYADDPEATAASFQDGWYRTGDRGELDGEGYLSIVGRVGDTIRTGGEAVAPAEVEAVIAEHPSVRDVAVFGRPDPTWGAIVGAALVLHPGRALPTATELSAHLDGRLARFKHPRLVVAVDSLPRTAATGQLQRNLVDTLAAEALAGGDATDPP